MTRPNKRLSTQARGGLFGYVSRKLASWVWYDTHLPLSRGAHVPRLTPSKDNLTFGSRGTS